MQKLYQQLKNQHQRLQNLFIIFILAQPFLDLLAYFHIPLSTPVRLLVIPIGLLYILSYPEQEWRRNTFVYVTVLCVYFLASFLINMAVKEPVSAAGELTFIFKTLFFIVTLLVYMMIFRNIQQHRAWRQTIPKYLFINTAFVSGVMLVAELTGTGKRSYDYLEKQGHSGWFFSGNEISAILGMGFCGAMIYYLLIKKSVLTNSILTALIVMMIWAMLTIGTKVAFGSALLLLGIALLVSLARAIITKKNVVMPVVLLLLLAGTYAVTPSMPIGNNLGLSVEMANEKAQQQAEQPPEAVPEGGETVLPGSQRQYSSWQLMMLNGREEFFGTVSYYFDHAPAIQKLFGMGIGGNYIEEPRIIEMDILDWFFGFGYIGIVLLVLPLVFAVAKIIQHIYKYRFRSLSVISLVSGIGACIGLGAAFVAGHILSSPASGFYLALLLAFTYGLTKDKHQPFFDNDQL